MASLLLLCGTYPHDGVTEFLTDEVGYLAKTFGSIRVVPARPKGPRVSVVPPGVVVDYSLARRLAGPPGFPRRSGRATSLATGQLSRQFGRGVSKGLPMPPFRDLGWHRSVLQGRGDATQTWRWARDRPEPDVAYTFWLGPFTLGLRAAWMNTALVSRAHGGDVYSEASGWPQLPFQAPALSACDKVYCVSEHGRRYLAAKFPASAASLSVARIGSMDIGLAAPRSHDGRVKIMSVSAMDSNKRVALIAEAVVRLSQRCPVSWLHLGEGVEMEQVRRIVGSANSSLEVRLPGWVARDNVASELASGAHDVVVNASQSEGVPVSLIEAQCAGLPVVATDVGGSAEAALPSLNVLVDPTVDPATLAEAIERATRLPLSWRVLRREWWRTTFAQDSVYPRFASQLSQLRRP